MDEERRQEEQTEEEPIKLDRSATDIKVPEHLYEYRALDIRTLSALAMNRLFFVDYKLFNDPFDCQAVPKLEREAKESLRK